MKATLMGARRAGKKTVLASAREIREIAQAIADELFVTGQGEHADRLVLWVDADERNLGGWAKRAVIDRIVKHLQAFRRL